LGFRFNVGHLHQRRPIGWSFKPSRVTRLCAGPTGRFPTLQSVLPYWIAQLAGAFVAGGMHLFLFTTAINNYEAELEIADEDFLESASAFGNYWR
jgi:glycerol uptake facilitator-like aquaporin